MKNDQSSIAFRDLEWDCELAFKQNAHYWHLYTDGRNADMIFKDKTDMQTGMNLIALSCIHYPDVKVFTFELMNNHLHMILAGQRQHCIDIFVMFKACVTKLYV